MHSNMTQNVRESEHFPIFSLKFFFLHICPLLTTPLTRYLLSTNILFLSASKDSFILRPIFLLYSKVTSTLFLTLLETINACPKTQHVSKISNIEDKSNYMKIGKSKAELSISYAYANLLDTCHKITQLPHLFTTIKTKGNLLAPLLVWNGRSFHENMAMNAIPRMLSTFLSINPLKQQNVTWKDILHTKDCTPYDDVHSRECFTLHIKHNLKRRTFIEVNKHRYKCKHIAQVS